MKILANVDYSKNEIQNAVIQKLAADPGSPVTGQTYFNTTSNKIRTYNGSTWDEYGTSTAAGTVTSVAVATANGFSGTVANSSTTPSITMQTSATGVLKGNGTAISAATQGTDYYAPSGTDVAVADGGTGASDATNARSNLGLVIGTNVLAPSGSGAALTGITQSQVTSLVSDLGLKAPLASPSLTGTPTAPTASASTNTTQVATTAYADAAVAAVLGANDAMVYKGVIDASTNPNYPASNAGDTYKISVAGKVGGASGTSVEVGDMIIGTVDSSAAGTQAAVGANWNVIQANVDGVVTGPASSTTGNLVSFNGTTGKVVQDSGKVAPTGVILGTTDTQTVTNKNLNSGTNTFPTFNQNTTGSAATLTTPRTINGVSFNGSANITISATTKYTGTIGDNSATAIAVTHGLGSQYVTAQVFDATSNVQVECDVTLTSSTQTTFTFSVAPTTNQYRVVIIG